MLEAANLQDAMISAMAQKVGTPLYIYNSAVIEKKYNLLKKCFSDNVDVFYSLKANPNKAVCARLQNLGAGAEVCSITELEIALLAGYLPQNIIYVGPVKTAETIVRLLELHIYAIICESKEEFHLINKLAEARSVVADVAIRVNPAFSVRSASLKMGGAPSQFGIDYQELLRDKMFFLTKKNINIIGLHIYNGTRILQADVIAENINKICQFSKEFMAEWKIPISMLDVGGGIGVPYFANEESCDLEKISSLVTPLLDIYRKAHPSVRIILESGRYLVAEAGVFVCQVQNVKQSHGKLFLMTDGGMHCHLTAAGYGGLIKRNFPIQLLTQSKAKKTFEYQIAGPLCTPADLIGRDVLLPKAKVGDLIVLSASGAYGPTASPVLFLGHGHPAEVLLEQDGAYLVREKDNFQDVITKQCYLPI